MLKSAFIIFITLIFKGETLKQEELSKTLEANVQIVEAKFDAKCREIETMKEYENKLMEAIKIINNVQ